MKKVGDVNVYYLVGHSLHHNVDGWRKLGIVRFSCVKTCVPHKLVHCNSLSTSPPCVSLRYYQPLCRLADDEGFVIPAMYENCSSLDFVFLVTAPKLVSSSHLASAAAAGARPCVPRRRLLSLICRCLHRIESANQSTLARSLASQKIRADSAACLCIKGMVHRLRKAAIMP